MKVPEFRGHIGRNVVEITIKMKIIVQNPLMIKIIMMLYRNTKVKVHSPDRDTDYFDIVPGVLQGNTLAPYLFIICLDYVLRTSIDKMKEKGFKLTKERSRKYPAQTITDTDYAKDIALLAKASMHTRWNICTFIKEATSHKTVAL